MFCIFQKKFVRSKMKFMKPLGLSRCNCNSFEKTHNSLWAITGLKKRPSLVGKCLFSSQFIEEGCIYIHWPYCRKLCSYCNFVKFIPRQGKLWTFPSEVIENGLGILERIAQCCFLDEEAEVTLEVNPTRVELKKLKGFKKAGVNRISLGVQSLNPDNLKILNRDHDVQETRACLDTAKSLFPGRVSMDIIFALPFQTVEMWKGDLDSVLSVCDSHLSLYQLTLERGTKLYHDAKSGELHFPDEETQASMFEDAISALEESGFYRYEVSNFAKTFASEGAHNKSVWQGSQFIGIGPGASSRVFCGESANDNYVREARRNTADPASWLAEVKAKGNGIRLVEQQSILDILMEYLYTGLRTIEGVKHDRWMQICGKPLVEFIDPNCLNSDLLYWDSSGDLKATKKGLNVLDLLLPNLAVRFKTRWESSRTY